MWHAASQSLGVQALYGLTEYGPKSRGLTATGCCRVQLGKIFRPQPGTELWKLPGYCWGLNMARKTVRYAHVHIAVQGYLTGKLS